MYLEHFKLKRMPFENALESDLFFKSEIHSEAYSRMSYIIENKKSCGVLTGGYGTGKTFVMKKIEKDLSRKGYVFSFVINPRMNELGILKMILHNFTGYSASGSKEDVLMGLEKFFKDAYKDGKHSVVIIDEAQGIESESVLEELRLLLNYQTDTRSLLTLILSGQSELEERIYSNRQFSQRIFMSYGLRPFNKDETVNYINHRLSSAQGEEKYFSQDALGLIYDRSGGIARWINNICNMSMMEAFSKGKSIVDEDCVSQAIKSFKE